MAVVNKDTEVRVKCDDMKTHIPESEIKKIKKKTWTWKSRIQAFHKS